MWIGPLAGCDPSEAQAHQVNRYQAGYTLQQDSAGTWKISETRVRMRKARSARILSDDRFFEGSTGGGGYLDPLDLLEGGMEEDP